MNKIRRMSFCALAMVLFIGSFSTVVMAARTKIVVAYRNTSDFDYAWFEAQMKIFNNTKYEIELIRNTGAVYVEQFALLLATKQQVDMSVWMGPETMIPPFFQDDVWVDMTYLLERDGMARGYYYPAILETGVAEGQQVFLPWSVDPGMLIYDIAKMDNAGLRHPTLLAETGDWTWDVFLSYAKKLTRDVNGDGNVDIFGYSPSSWVWLPGFLSWIHSNGGSWFAPATGKVFIADPPAIEAMDFWTSLSTVHGVWGGEMRQNNVAMQTSYPSYTSYLTQPVGMVVNPSRTKGSAPVHFTISAGGLLVKGGNIEGAWEFMKLLQSAASQRELARITNRVPSCISATGTWVDNFKSKGLYGEQVFKAFETVQPLPYSNPAIDVNNKLVPIFRTEMTKVLNKQIGVRPALEEVARQSRIYIEEALANYKK